MIQWYKFGVEMVRKNFGIWVFWYEVERSARERSVPGLEMLEIRLGLLATILCSRLPS